MLAGMSESSRPIITADRAVFGSTATASAALRDEHIWPVVVDANALIEDVVWNSVPRERPSALLMSIVGGPVPSRDR